MDNQLYTSRSIGDIATLTGAGAAKGFLNARYESVREAHEWFMQTLPSKVSASGETQKSIETRLMRAVLRRKNMWTIDSRNWPPEARVIWPGSLFVRSTPVSGLGYVLRAYTSDNPQPMNGTGYDNSAQNYAEDAVNALTKRLDEVVVYIASDSAGILIEDAKRFGEEYATALDARILGMGYNDIGRLIGQPHHRAMKIVGIAANVPLYSEYASKAYFAERAYNVLVNHAVKGGEVFVDSEKLVNFYAGLSELANRHYNILMANQTSDDLNATIALDLKEILEGHGVSRRVVSAVERSRILLSSWERFLRMNAPDLLRIRNLGEKGLAELSRVREEMGYGSIPQA